MKLTRIIGLGAVLALTIGATAFAGGPNDRVTGGGQILLGTKGAGSTIAFSLQGSGSDVKGQFQHVDRSAGTGQSQDSWHGTPVCLEVQGNMAKAVIERRDNGDLYELVVVDNGQGAAAENDMVTLSTDEDPTCGSDDNDDDNTTALGRGNIQVYDAP